MPDPSRTPPQVLQALPRRAARDQGRFDVRVILERESRRILGVERAPRGEWGNGGCRDWLMEMNVDRGNLGHGDTGIPGVI